MNKIIIAALTLAAFGAAAVPEARAQDEAASDKVFEADKGSETIDISKYPKEQQENYKVFSEKCAKCHTLARPINSQYALPEEWSAYVDKMRHKKRSGIDDDSQKIITDFLIYDSAVRKKDLIAQKLKDKAAAKDGDKKDAAKPDAKPASAPAQK
jgi:hypothetical protein